MKCPNKECNKKGQGYVALVDRTDRSKGKEYRCRACGVDSKLTKPID